tara:strand:- start:32 stop:253 length:222 start_codon:yes stop_codon:yes gene_type:complete
MKKTNLVKKFTALSIIGTGLVISLINPSQVKADNGYLMTQEQIKNNSVQNDFYLNSGSDHCIIAEIIYGSSNC